jgi:NitT/TauT family transport system ATP-binding protein
VLVMAARPGRIVAEVVIDAPHPRPQAFRHEAGFHAACRAVAEAMGTAVA